VKIYIKNSKIDLPPFIKGLITQVRDYSSPPLDELGNQPICAYLYWRVTSTGRRVWSGTNHWDLFTIVAEEGYIVDDTPGVVLGLYAGIDIGFGISRVVAPAIRVPNTTVLPAKTEVVDDLRFLAVLPSPDRGCESSVPDAFDRLPFHRPGGKGEECQRDMWEREIVSYYAHEYPDEYRAAADPLAAAKEKLLFVE